MFLFNGDWTIRSNSAWSKNITIHHLRQNTEQKPERTTAIPPARIAVLIQQRNNTEATKPTKPKTPKMVKSKARGYPVQINSKESHTAITDLVLTRLKIKKAPSQQGKSRDPNLHSETSETTTTAEQGDRLPVTKCREKSPSLTIASQYPSYNCASIRMPIITKALYSLAFIIMQC